jgi:hypothetical protein
LHGNFELEALIRENPLELAQTTPEGYSSKLVRQATLDLICPAAALFHSGYLTIEGARLADSATAGDCQEDLFFAFRAPNSEVEKSYDYNLCSSVFDLTRSS